MDTLKRLTANPYLNLFVGIILLFSGISEAMHEWEEMEAIRLGVHHGVILFSILHLLKTLPELFESLDRIERVQEQDAG